MDMLRRQLQRDRLAGLANRVVGNGNSKGGAVDIAMDDAAGTEFLDEIDSCRNACGRAARGA